MGLTTESKRGSNCSGTDGTTNRVLTLANNQLTQSGGFSVYVNGLLLVPTTEYTPSHIISHSTVTLLNTVWDTDYIVLIYQQGATPATTGRYCTYTDVYTKTGLSTAEVSSAVVDALILDAEAEIDTLTGRSFSNANGFSEYVSIRDKDVIGNYQTTIQLSHWPIQSITLYNTYDLDGTVVDTYGTLTAAQILAGTLETTDYWLEVQNDPLTNTAVPNGHVCLKTDTLPKGTNNVKITYTYGYDTVPQLIKTLDTCLTGVRVWVAFMGASYNRLNSYSIPQQSVNKGDFYTRCQDNIKQLTEEANRLLDRIGRKPRTLFFASGAPR